MALYIPHSIFHLGAAFVYQAGNFWTLLRIKMTYTLVPNLESECMRLQF